ncbi:MAG: hypothetical protein JNK05_11845 [Myxococcales bacterium]|nr:hypothetical protein [Myxococcales bacterium]
MRLRVAVGAYSGFWGIGSTPNFLPGIGGYARVGAQFTERFGLDAQISGAALNGWAVRGAVTAEFAPADWFAVGSGVSVVRLNTAAPLFGGYEQNITFAGVPLRIAFRVGGRSTGRARQAFEILVEGDLGVGSRRLPDYGSGCGCLSGGWGGGIACTEPCRTVMGANVLDYGWAIGLGLGYARF